MHSRVWLWTHGGTVVNTAGDMLNVRGEVVGRVVENIGI